MLPPSLVAVLHTNQERQSGDRMSEESDIIIEDELDVENVLVEEDD